MARSEDKPDPTWLFPAGAGMNRIRTAIESCAFKNLFPAGAGMNRFDTPGSAQTIHAPVPRRRGDEPPCGLLIEAGSHRSVPRRRGDEPTGEYRADHVPYWTCSPQARG